MITKKEKALEKEEKRRRGRGSLSRDLRIRRSFRGS
jgi:hypothetical protein